MRTLEQTEIDRVRQMSAAEKMRAVFEAVDAGVRIKRAALRAKHPAATEAEIDAALRAWLLRDDD